MSFLLMFSCIILCRHVDMDGDSVSYIDWDWVLRSRYKRGGIMDGTGNGVGSVMVRSVIGDRFGSITDH